MQRERENYCPECGARPGQACCLTGGPYAGYVMSSIHQARSWNGLKKIAPAGFLRAFRPGEFPELQSPVVRDWCKVQRW